MRQCPLQSSAVEHQLDDRLLPDDDARGLLADALDLLAGVRPKLGGIGGGGVGHKDYGSESSASGEANWTNWNKASTAASP